uniref:p27 n=1 Tax=Grapevine leafroll-associated virus 7 TaxID=217615 RepID=G8H423_9CLOS|nr:P27 [Grapevine leafroll-associated virus 7]
MDKFGCFSYCWNVLMHICTMTYSSVNELIDNIETINDFIIPMTNLITNTDLENYRVNEFATRLISDGWESISDYAMYVRSRPIDELKDASEYVLSKLTECIDLNRLLKVIPLKMESFLVERINSKWKLMDSTNAMKREVLGFDGSYDEESSSSVKHLNNLYVEEIIRRYRMLAVKKFENLNECKQSKEYKSLFSLLSDMTALDFAFRNVKVKSWYVPTTGSMKVETYINK